MLLRHWCWCGPGFSLRGLRAGASSLGSCSCQLSQLGGDGGCGDANNQIQSFYCVVTEIRTANSSQQFSSTVAYVLSFAVLCVGAAVGRWTCDPSRSAFT